MQMGEQFPFGAPVSSMAVEPRHTRPVFVLGAYPSALHVRWVPPDDSGLKPIRALAVDNEPWPFWDGNDERDRIEVWSEQWFDDRCGTVAPAGSLNGSSGRWVRDQVLRPLGARPDDVWITDCLDTYRASDGQRRRIVDTYDALADEFGLPTAMLGEHPDEDQIVREALDTQRQRLLRELEVVSPEVIVTLGRAAARVLHAILELDGEAELSQDDYGAFTYVAFQDRPLQWVAFAHPGAPARWQAVHKAWRTQQVAADTGMKVWG